VGLERDEVLKMEAEETEKAKIATLTEREREVLGLVCEPSPDLYLQEA
jgi:FixJ family two-component response regulator